MCSLVMNLRSCDVITNGSRLTGLTCSKAPGYWMVEHQLVHTTKVICAMDSLHCIFSLPVNYMRKSGVD